MKRQRAEKRQNTPERRNTLNRRNTLKRRVLSALIPCVLLLPLCVPLGDPGVSASPSLSASLSPSPLPATAPQFTLVFERGGVFRDLGGNEIEMPVSLKVGGAVKARPRFDMWHHHADGAAGDYWRWTAGTEAGNIFIDSSDGIEGIMPNYMNFDELMRRSGAEGVFGVPLPDEVRKIVDSGRRVIAVVRAGYAADATEIAENRLDVDRMFPLKIAWSERMFTADAGNLTIRLPIKFNFLREDANDPNSPIITLQKASEAIADDSGSVNRIVQAAPGLPIPAKGYGRVLGAVKGKPDVPARADSGDGLGSHEIYYSDGTMQYASEPSSPDPNLDPNGPWWLGHLRTYGAGETSIMALDPKYNERIVHTHDRGYMGSEISVGERGGAYLLASVGATFYFPIEVQFYIAEAENLSASIKEHISSARPGDIVDLGFFVASTFPGDVRTTYTITVDGRTEPARPLSVPYGGEEAVPYRFAMPNRDVSVAFAVNPGGNDPIEANLSDNTVELVIAAAMPVETKGDITLDYDVLTQIESFRLGGAAVRLSLPALSGAQWTGPAVGSLIVTNETPELYRDFTVEGGTRRSRDSFAIGISSNAEEITLDPTIRTKIVRDWDNYLDDPAYGDYGENNVQEKIDPPMLGMATAQGSVNRPYSYTVRHTDWYYDSELEQWVSERWSETEYGTVTASFGSVDNYKSIVVNVYNGAEALPFGKAFLNELENSAVVNGSATYDLWWEGVAIQLDTVRWMNHRDADGNIIRWEAVDGQYGREFSGQSACRVTWETGLSQEAGYRADRGAAWAGRTGRGNYENAVFATDRALQSIGYPIKSGYYFNPLGEYTATVRTSQYKDTGGPTEEHAELVELVAASFRYSSDLQYVASGGNVTKLANVSESNSRSVLSVSTGATRRSAARLETASARTGNVDALLQEAMEGYTASGTDASRALYRYRERTDAAIYLVEEETVISFVIASPPGKNMYTHTNMPNGSYAIRVWMDPFVFAGPDEGRANLAAPASGNIDRITITVSGSMYDDR